MYDNPKTNISQLFCQLHAASLGGVALIDHIDITLGGCLGAIFLQPQVQNALQTNRKTGGWCRLAPQQGKQVIITPAPTDGALGAQLIRNPFKYGEVVIIQAPYQARV